METFASRRATKFKLKAAQPVDYNTGFDLSQTRDQDATEAAIEKFNPLVLLQGFSCKEWTILQDNCNYVHRPEELEQRREEVRPLLKKVIEWCKKQMAEGRFFALENPTTSRLWLEPLVVELLQHSSVMLAHCHGGAYGAVNSKGEMIRKPFTFMTNCPELYQRLQRKLDSQQLKQCVPLERKETTLSQEYPPQMVNEILKGVKECARRMDPERFLPHQGISSQRLQCRPRGLARSLLLSRSNLPDNIQQELLAL